MTLHLAVQPLLQVVALHKDHYVFPISLLVTKVSGTGNDAIFMGVIKPSAEDTSSVKAYIMPGLLPQEFNL